MKKVIALCACPMGLMHTFMAAEAIEKTALGRGYDVKVETQGADGIRNKLSEKDIEDADIIIHSVEITPSEMERFEGKEVYEIPIADILRDPEGIFDEIEEDKGF